MPNPKENNKPKDAAAEKSQQNVPNQDVRQPVQYPVPHNISPMPQQYPAPPLGQNIPQMPRQYPPPYAPMPGYPPYQMPYAPAYAARRPKPFFTRLDSIFAALSFVAGFLLLRYMIWYQSGYFTTATTILMLGFVILYLVKRGYTLRLENYICAGVITIMSFIFSVTSDNAIKGWTVIALLGLGAYFVFSVCSGRKFSEFFFRDQTNAVIFPFHGFGFNFLALGKGKDEKKSNRLGNVLIGLCISLPLFFIVLLLLISADRAMYDLVTNFFDLFAEDILLAIPQFVFGIPIAMYLFGMMYVNASKRSQYQTTDEVYNKSKASGRVLPKSAVFATLTPILLLYVVFFFSQLPYYTAGFSGTLPNGLEYAYYAREGFIQLVFLTMLNLVLIILMQRFSREDMDKKSLSLRIFSILFSLSTLVLVASALSKMFMYIQSYGLTRDRVHATWLIVLIALVFIFIVIKQFVNRFPLIRSIVVTTILMFGLLAFGRVDYQIARFNITMYKEGYHKELDFGYLLYSLGDESLLYILENDEIDTLQKAADANAKKTYDEYYEWGNFGYYDEHNNYVKDPYDDQGWQSYREDVEAAIGYKIENGNRYRYYNFSSARLKQLAKEKYGMIFK